MYFMHNLHEMSNSFSGKSEKIFQNVCRKFYQAWGAFKISSFEKGFRYKR